MENSTNAKGLSAKGLSKVVCGIIAACLIVTGAMLAGCGAKPTLEDYAKAHPDEISQVEDTLNASMAGMGSCEVEVEGNSINYVLTINQNFNEMQISMFKSTMDSNLPTLEAQVKPTIQQMEEESGISDITVSFECKDAAGADLGTYTID